MEWWKKVQDWFSTRYGPTPEFATMEPEEKKKYIKAVTEQVEIMKETEKDLDKAITAFVKALDAFHIRKDRLLDQRRELRKQLRETDSENTEEKKDETSGKEEIDEQTKKEEERIKSILSHNIEKEIPRLIKKVEHEIKQYEEQISDLEQKKAKLQAKRKKSQELLLQAMQTELEYQFSEPVTIVKDELLEGGHIIPMKEIDEVHEEEKNSSKSLEENFPKDVNTLKQE